MTLSPKKRKSTVLPDKTIGSRQTQIALRAFAKQLSRTTSLQPGTILFRLIGSGGGSFCLECTLPARQASQTKASSLAIALVPVSSLDKSEPCDPRIEIIGDARRILAILSNRKEARLQFLAGGFRVRGDLEYLNQLALGLGLLKEPIL